MIYVAISASVLALAVSGAVGVWLIISSHRTRELERLQSRTESELRKLAVSSESANASALSALRELESKTPVKIAAEVAALSDAVSKLAETHRKFAGRVWAELQHRHGRVSNGDTGEDDAELQAMLALQNRVTAQ